MWFSRCQSMLAIKATQKDQDDLTRIIRYFVLQFSHQSRLAIHKHTSFGCPQFWVGTNPLIYSLIFGCGAITVPQRQSCTTWRHGQFEATRGQPVCYKRPRGDAQAICSLFISYMVMTQSWLIPRIFQIKNQPVPKPSHVWAPSDGGIPHQVPQLQAQPPNFRQCTLPPRESSLGCEGFGFSLMWFFSFCVLTI